MDQQASIVEFLAGSARRGRSVARSVEDWKSRAAGISAGQASSLSRESKRTRDRGLEGVSGPRFVADDRSRRIGNHAAEGRGVDRGTGRCDRRKENLVPAGRRIRASRRAGESPGDQRDFRWSVPSRRPWLPRRGIGESPRSDGGLVAARRASARPGRCTFPQRIAGPASRNLAEANPRSAAKPAVDVIEALAETWPLRWGRPTQVTSATFRADNPLVRMGNFDAFRNRYEFLGFPPAPGRSSDRRHPNRVWI